jgi:hypothetical protein
MEVVNKYYNMFDPKRSIRIRERVNEENLDEFEEFLIQNIEIDENIVCDYGILTLYIKDFAKRQRKQRNIVGMSSIYSDKSDTNLQPFLTQESGSSPNVILAKIILNVIDRRTQLQFSGGRKSRRKSKKSRKSRKSRR